MQMQTIQRRAEGQEDNRWKDAEHQKAGGQRETVHLTEIPIGREAEIWLIFQLLFRVPKFKVMLEFSSQPRASYLRVNRANSRRLSKRMAE